ncbi:hypothetical protein CEP51_016050 [Fusarium floridanum]|uniref:Uncharacterized protein n=1 Tax=Fusarium floridanum TaxID=1325733 RepID=A0A428NXU5_9HYPO|nr:hypothetical protein CEP51_016050 [Fusarium floridanum]
MAASSSLQHIRSSRNINSNSKNNDDDDDDDDDSGSTSKMYPFGGGWVFGTVPAQPQVVYYQQDTIPVNDYPQTSQNDGRRRRRRNRNGARRHQDNNNVTQPEHLEGPAREPQGRSDVHVEAREDAPSVVAKQDLEERDSLIELQKTEIEALRAEVQSAKQAERDLRKEAYRTIGALRSNLNLAEKAKEELISVVGEKDRLISQQRVRIEALERSPIYHNDGTPPTNTSWPGIELPSDVRDRMRALNVIARWEEWFRFVDDAEFDDGAQAEVSSILEEAQSRGRLYELLMEGPLDTWYCLRYRIANLKTPVASHLEVLTFSQGHRRPSCPVSVLK